MKAVLLLFSGGFDSTLTALLLRDRGFVVHGLSITFLGRPRKEILIARRIGGGQLFASFVECNLSFGKPLFDPKAKILYAGKADEPSAGCIPYRNLAFWSIAMAVASRKSIVTIAGGHTRKDAADYRDASPQFFRTLRLLTAYSGEKKVVRRMNFRLPLQELTPNIYARTVRKHLPFLCRTWSCWLDGNQPCGSCYACIERQRYLNEQGSVKKLRHAVK